MKQKRTMPVSRLKKLLAAARAGRREYWAESRKLRGAIDGLEKDVFDLKKKVENLEMQLTMILGDRS